MRDFQELQAANHFLSQKYVAEFNRRFAAPAGQKGTAFVRTQRKDLESIFSVQQERTVNRDNT